MLGNAAMLLFFDIAPEAIAEHDDWHTHEHLPERLSIPGFLRGTRWVALRPGQPRYLVIYEVRNVGVLTSEAYLTRLNHPTPWTSKMMQHYRGVTRGFCSVTGRAGLGLGSVALVMRFKPAGDAAALRNRLVKHVLPGLSLRPGLGGCYLFESVVQRCMVEGLVGGEGFAVDASVVKADANRTRGIPGAVASNDATQTTHAVREYLAALDPDSSVPKNVSLTDPEARWTVAPGGPAFFAYSTNYLVDVEAGVIVDVEATTALRYAWLVR